jgi:hypothetical protein
VILPTNRQHPFATYRFADNGHTEPLLIHGDYCETFESAVTSYTDRLAPWRKK